MPTTMPPKNLVAPITLAFLMGMIASLIRSDLEIPDPVIRIISSFLLFSIGIQGAQQLLHVSIAQAAAGLGVLAAQVLLLPHTAFVVAHTCRGCQGPMPTNLPPTPAGR